MLLLATDLDGTFLAGENIHKQQLYRLMRESKDALLVFVTGRGLETVIPLLNDPGIPNPHYIICDVGATIVNGTTLEPIQPLQSDIEAIWPAHLNILHQLKAVKNLHKQEVPQMRRCSFFYDGSTDLEQVKSIADSMGFDMLLSAEKFLDILPPGVNKGSSLKKLVDLLNISAKDVLVAGDSLNDLSLYNAGYKGVVVGKAEKKLLEATLDMQPVYHAEKTGCGGILESLAYFREFHVHLRKRPVDTNYPLLKGGRTGKYNEGQLGKSG